MYFEMRDLILREAKSLEGGVWGALSQGRKGGRSAQMIRGGGRVRHVEEPGTLFARAVSRKARVCRQGSCLIGDAFVVASRANACRCTKCAPRVRFDRRGSAAG